MAGIEAITRIVWLLAYDLFFLFALIVLVMLLARQKRAAYAVLRRNFLGYFSNPTGYVFLCLFVLLTSMAAFWPHEFFSNNLATLNQLNNWFPIIMLFFIPAITMSIWADERRQGTDELLLTLPADDFDIVIGKYLAAGAIYTSSLLFSQISSFIVLIFLTQGEVDMGLFFSNYLGYWCIGMAMISIGMVASFLTPNLTVGFILGAIFNAPLAFAAKSDLITAGRYATRWIKDFSMSERFDDFGRGIVSLSSFAYFALVATVGLYLCMVLIGRRHWSGGKEGNFMFAQYMTRIICLAIVAVAGSFFFRNHDLRYDLTDGKISSISAVTRKIIREMKPDRTIFVNAFISSEIPEIYAKTRYELIHMLKEFESAANGSNRPMVVRIQDGIDVFSDEAKQAEKGFGIAPQTVRVRERGQIKDQQVILGAAFTSGLQKVVVPFFSTGVPVEYELVRSLKTVAQSAKKKLGVLKTDAQLTGGFSMTTFSQTPRQPIITELEKQYEIVDVNPASPISPDMIDVLLAVQPSSLGPAEMNNFIDAVKAGIPTAIFEDPRPDMYQDVPGTGEPKRQGGAMGMFGGGGQQPKGDIRPLWKLLGLKIPGGPSMTGGINPDLCWQQYNPYPILASINDITDEWVFVREGLPGVERTFNDQSEITKDLREILFLTAGAVQTEDSTDMKVTKLVTTGENAGLLEMRKLESLPRMRGNQAQYLRVLQGPPTGPQTLAVYVEGKAPAAPKDSESATATNDSGAADAKMIRAVYVADIDCIGPAFVDIRNQPNAMSDIQFRMQNITFLLNAIDVLAGELDYPEVRRHEPQYSTLKLIEMQAEDALEEEAQKRLEFAKKKDEAIQKAEEDNQRLVQNLQDRVRKLQEDNINTASKQRELQEAVIAAQQMADMLNNKLSVKREQLEQELNHNIAEAKRTSDLKIQSIQNVYKWLAVFLPPIPPLIVGVVVLVSRLLREREGISKSRLR